MEYHKIETLYVRNEKTFKVDPSQLKNRVYGQIKSWCFTEKIDGTNIRCMWDYKTQKLTFGGRTDNAQIHADLVKHLYDAVSEEKIKEMFPGCNLIIYGEGYGAGIQKGGGYSETKKFIVFDILVDDKWWLAQENVNDIANKLSLDVVPYVGEMTLEDATEFVKHGFKSKLNGGLQQAEGLVGRTIEPLFDKKGHRLIIKLKTKDF